MIAIRVHRTGGAEVLESAEVPQPEAAAGELLVKVAATGVNFIDVYQRSGFYPINLPFTPGSELSGVVEAVGPNVSGFQTGDRVAIAGNAPLGAYAQYARIPAARAVKVPAGVELKQAAAVMLQGMTAHYLATSTRPLMEGMTAVIHAAAGGVGLLLTQMAKRRGAIVIGTVSTEEKAALARDAGADEVILYTKEEVAPAVKKLTGGRGAEVVYDSVGKSTFEQSIAALAPRGMLVSFGQSSGPVPPFDPLILSRNGSLFLTRPTLAHYTLTREELERRANDVLGWVANGSLKVHIGAEFALIEATKAHCALESRKTTGKVLLIP